MPKKKFYKDISKIASYASSKDVTVCLEMHGGWCNTGKKGAEIVKTINNPSIKLNYDSNTTSHRRRYRKTLFNF